MPIPILEDYIWDCFIREKFVAPNLLLLAFIQTMWPFIFKDNQYSNGKGIITDRNWLIDTDIGTDIDIVVSSGIATDIATDSGTDIRGLYHKTYYGCNLRIYVIS